MQTDFADISIKGKIQRFPATMIAGHKIVVRGAWLRTAEIFDECWQEGSIQDPQAVISGLQRESVKADLFTFAQKLPDTEPKYSFDFQWNNWAVIPITTYENWWERLSQETRRNVRLSGKRGLRAELVPFDETLVAGIKRIYDESPTRQGRPFWHYGKSLEAVRRDNSTYADRSDFIGAFLNGELIGFLKLVYMGKVSGIMQILSLSRHSDKRPTNALIAKAVETCASKGVNSLVYEQYVYGNNDKAPLVEFKRRNGFEKVLYPRYYVPLTVKGRAALMTGLHLGLRRIVPRPIEASLLRLRNALYARQSGVS